MGSERTARQGNEINTARRLLKIGFAPVDLLYSESLTKVTKVTKVRGFTSHHSLVKKTLHRHRAGFEPQRASSFMKRVKASQILGEAVRA